MQKRGTVISGLIAILSAAAIDSYSPGAKTVNLSGIVLGGEYVLKNDLSNLMFYRNNPAHFAVIKIRDNYGKIQTVFLSSDRTFIGEDGRVYEKESSSYRSSRELRHLVSRLICFVDSVFVRAKEFKTPDGKRYYVATSKLTNYNREDKVSNDIDKSI